MRLKVSFLIVLALSCVAAAAQAQVNGGRLVVQVDKPGVKISPMLYGLMTEEINHAYDGGLYAELIQNRAFKDSDRGPVHWTLIQEGGGAGSISLDSTQPINEALSTCLKLSATSASPSQRVGVANSGFWGIPAVPNTRYKASFYAKGSDGFAGPVSVDIESSDGKTVAASGRVAKLVPGWHQYTVALTTGSIAATAECRFVISMNAPGAVYINLVSLFPPTYNNRPNGNRVDLMKKLAAMKPAFLRLPGGNYLEGNTIAERFEWKDTIHTLSERPGHMGPWGYRSSDGLGLLEFLDWCEDLHMQPVLAVFAGYALRGEHVGPGPDLAPFVHAALDEIEYATGAITTHWGAQRAADGHPAPFKIEYVEIGNEDNFDRSRSYDGRFTQFYDAIKAKYPALKIIATAAVRTRTPDVMDDHYYRSAREMERDVHHYDSYDRAGPKVFVGEWASTEGNPTPTMNAALGDAAWLTGLERNSDLVVISSYAPLLVNVNRGAAQWGTNLIGYDALSSFGSPSYYAQAMFANNRGDVVLPVNITVPAAAPQAAAPPQGAVGVGTWETQAEYKDIKVTQGNRVLYQNDVASGFNNWSMGQGAWKAQDGVLRQSSEATDCRATAGDSKWTNYTYTLKARKIAGAEGFLILFHVQDADNWVWWNVGGWGDTRTAIERDRNGAKTEISRPSPVTVETGRWYDIRVEVEGSSIRCYLDDKLVTEATDAPPAPVTPIYSTASRDMATGDVILKVVNIASESELLRIDFEGVKDVAKLGSAEVLAGLPTDVNTIAEPTKVAPKKTRIVDASPRFNYVFPPYSVSVLRLKVR